MLSRLQVWLLLSCAVLVIGVLAVIRFWPLLSKQWNGMVHHNSIHHAGPQNAPQTFLPDRYFQLVVKHQGGPQRNDDAEKKAGELELKYTHQKSVDGVVVTFYSMAVRSFEKGQLQQTSEMTRDQLVQQNGKQTVAVWGEQLSAGQREQMSAAFGTNFSKILLDGNQNETGRQILSPLGRFLITDSLVDTARFPHGPFCPGLKSWTANKRIPITPEMILECSLNYKKAAPDRIEVTGTATKTEVESDTPGVSLKKVSCNVSGTEAFDESTWEYVSANLTIDYSFEVFEKEALRGTMKGELAISLFQVVRR